MHLVLVLTLPIGLASVYEETTKLPIFMASSAISGSVVAVLLVNRIEVRSYALAVSCSWLVVVCWFALGFSLSANIWIYLVGCAASSYAGVWFVDLVEVYTSSEYLNISLLMVAFLVTAVGYVSVQETRAREINKTSQLREQFAYSDLMGKQLHAELLARYLTSKQPGSLLLSLCTSLLPLAEDEHDWNSIPEYRREKLLPSLAICWGYPRFGSSDYCDHDELDDYVACLMARSRERIREGQGYPSHIGKM